MKNNEGAQDFCTALYLIKKISRLPESNILLLVTRRAIRSPGPTAINHGPPASAILNPDPSTSIFMSLSWWTTWPLTSLIDCEQICFCSARFLYRCFNNVTGVTSHWLLWLKRFPSLSAHTDSFSTFLQRIWGTRRGPGVRRFLKQMPYVVVSCSAHCKALHFNCGFSEGFKCSGSGADLFLLLPEPRLSRK